jgi:hypothetical protein
MNRLIYRLLIIIFLVHGSFSSHAQYLMDMLDTTKELGRSNVNMLKRFDHIRIAGYMQPQFQAASAKGAKGYSGGDFQPNSDNRFMLRRGRFRIDYVRTDKLQRNQLQFAFQIDGTERGVFIRDYWGRIWENKLEMFSFTTGMFARPFGFEVNYSSSDRESPERGRMSQILMKTERDLGFMTSFEFRKPKAKWKFFRIDAGIFNGQGLSGPAEFDSYKDLITQLVISPVKLTHKLTISGGLSLLYGGLVQSSKYTFRMKDLNGITDFVVDSVTTVPGQELPRHYYGINTQLKYRTGWGFTELRGEYWKGTQTATQQSSETPGTIPTLANGAYAPYYIRPFKGSFIYFLQNIVNLKNQVGVKLDWYDPNTKVKGTQIGAGGTHFTQADIRYTTIGAGYLYYMNENLKFVLWYDWVNNEITSLPGYTQDLSDNVFTLRVQYRF